MNQTGFSEKKKNSRHVNYKNGNSKSDDLEKIDSGRIFQ